VDLWPTVVRMHETEQHCHNTKFQKKVLRNTVDAPCYVRNAKLHTDLKMDILAAETKRFNRKHEERLLQHENVEAIQLLENTELLRKLK